MVIKMKQSSEKKSFKNSSEAVPNISSKKKKLKPKSKKQKSIPKISKKSKSKKASTSLLDKKSEDEMYKDNSTDMEDSVTDESEILSASELEQLLDDKVPAGFDDSDLEESSDFQTDDSASEESFNDEEGESSQELGEEEESSDFQMDESASNKSQTDEEGQSYQEFAEDGETGSSKDKKESLVIKSEARQKDFVKEAISREIELASRSLYFTSIPVSGCTLENLKQLSPSLQSARFSQSQKNKFFKTFAFLSYPDSASALKARKVLYGRQFGGKSVVTQPMQVPNYFHDAALHSTQLTVNCMLPSVKITDLKAIFPTADSIVLPRCSSSPENQCNLGYAFINFVDPKLALEAFWSAHHRPLHGLPLHVNFSAKEQSDRTTERMKTKINQKKVALLLKKEPEETEKPDEPESSKEVITSNSRRILIKTYSDRKDEPEVKREASSSSDEDELFLNPKTQKSQMSKTDFSSLISAAKNKTIVEQESGSEDSEDASDDSGDESDDDSKESELEVEEEEESSEEEEASTEEENEDSAEDASPEVLADLEMEEEDSPAPESNLQEQQEDSQLARVLKSMKHNKRMLKRGGVKRPRRPAKARVNFKRKKL